MAHSEFKHKKSELYMTALNAVIGSYTGSEVDFETIVYLSVEYDDEKHREQKEEAEKAEAEKPKAIDVEFSEGV